MPHTPDRRRLAARRAITCEPLTLARRGLPQREHLIDVPAAQQVLQSVLLQCFAYPHPVHPWDPEKGRHLPSLFSLYGTWVSPQAGRIVFGATDAARVCSYLLPFVLPGDWAARCAGVPGLRFDRPTSAGFALRHLPTGVQVEIQGGHRGSMRTLTRELS